MSTVLMAPGLVEDVHHPRKHVDDIRPDVDLVQSYTKVCRHLAGVDGIVGHRLETLIFGAEGDGVGLYRGIAVRRHRGDDARVQATAEK